MQQRRIMRLPEVITVTGYKRSSIYVFVALGKFPKPHRIGPRAIGWDSQAIDQWVNDRLEGRTQ